MTDAGESLIRSARQLLQTEALLGGSLLPAERNPLPAPAAAPGKGGSMTHSDKARALEAIDVGEVRSCTRCGLCSGRTQTVFGEGDADADLVFVGEGPGQEEDRTGRPFVGRAGEKLTEMIRAMGLTRQDVYICNLVKCRPPDNRTPAPEEIAACWDYLVRQLTIIRPKVIVALGSPAAQNLLSTRAGITQLRGQWQLLPPISPELQGTPVMPTFHPAYLLRQYTVENRQRVWSDIRAVMSRLGLALPKGRAE